VITENKLEEHNNKYIVMARGITASGKSTAMRHLKIYCERVALTSTIHSTDNYFITEEGRYKFDPKKLGAYHQKNLQAFSEDVQRGVDVVICDNTNLLPWHTESYTQVARAHSYNIVFVDFALRKLDEHLDAQEVTLAHPDAHNIPEAAIKTMMKDYETFKDLLDANTLVDPKKHRCYAWSPEKKKNLLSDEVCKHFDLDYLISPRTDILEETIKLVIHEFIKIAFSQHSH